MTSVVAKTVMKAIKANNVALIKSLAQRSRMSPGKLMSKAKAYSRKKSGKPTGKYKKSEDIGRAAEVRAMAKEKKKWKKKGY